MAVTLKGQSAIYEGTSADMKPSDADKNAIFQELDTGIDYYYDGTNWNEIPSSGGGGGGTGTDDYTDLNNKPKVNNVTVVGNLTSSDLKLQGEITSSHKLNADLVDDTNTANKFNVQADWNQATNSAPDYIKNKPTLGTAAATDATAYATAAQGTKADSAIQTVKVNDTALTPTSAKAVNITVPTQASDINALPNTTKYAAALSLKINSSTFVMTGQLKDQNGDNLGTAQTIDLPLESVVVGGSYNSQTKNVVLTLQNGDTIEFSVADLVSGLQTELSATNKLDPSFINYDTTHAAVTESDKTTWSGKQDALTFDGTYSASTNKAATVSTVTNAVNALDVTGDASVAASKTISAWSETDGKVSISTQDIAITGTQATLTGYAKSGTAGQAVAATDNVNQAIGKLEATVDDNKNNISSVQEQANWNTNNGVKNICPYNSGSTSAGEGTVWNNLPIDIAVGTYSVSFSTDSTNSALVLLAADGATEILRKTYSTTTVNDTFTISTAAKYIRLYIGASKTVSNFMIHSFGDDTFVPYALSNAELTAALQALQAQLANQ